MGGPGRSLKVRGLDDRAALGLVQVAAARLARLNRSRECCWRATPRSDEAEAE